ncbi:MULTISPECIES: flagellar motor switch protein FliN [Halomonas]|uniref:flagellar motor switch protein FliN n=1 Tax=Halomonas TaxID=2745 RepID=UPI001C96E7DA|nr:MULTISPECIES: flagellar motor switch protein FliN [Halomonas]MED5295176.1 flagellar motor switch protein FliN [Pseudomonadota bacterium]MBY5967848.1 flagellar motor switch protein FliN [Halomonas denitrificans]MBY5983350.1 flagellar motor switch protein FliN [Halomonas sp. DP5Y7-2]MBY6206150.1 flagellar motor switch protein FliN [Halomonas sp. DP3Y7-2]MBY6227959.1 flagellar motor switch protein FliN [Halomonas sp. DP3Y7-1]
MTDPNKPEDQVGDDDWAAAMSEQQDNDATTPEDDPWAEAMAEQQAADPNDDTATAADSPTPKAAGDSVFRPLGDSSSASGTRDLDMIMDIPVKLTVELGRTRLTIKQLLELAQGSVVELEGLAGEPMDILINGYLIAQGEVVVVEDRYGIRITEIITPSERVQKLNR